MQEAKSQERCVELKRLIETGVAVIPVLQRMFFLTQQLSVLHCCTKQHGSWLLYLLLAWENLLVRRDRSAIAPEWAIVI